MSRKRGRGGAGSSRGAKRPTIKKPAAESSWVDVVVAVVRDGERVLVAKRPATAHLGGFDEFPGGRRESSETLEEACVREVREETGLAVRVVRQLAIAWHADAQRRLALTFFECALAGAGDIAPDLAAKSGARWVERRELGSLSFPPANRDVVRKLLEEPAAGAALPPDAPAA